MHRHRQFGMRENPASDQRHASRLVVGTKSSSHFDGKENGEAQNTITPAGPASGDVHHTAHAATNLAATGETRSDAGRLLTIPDVAELLQVPVSWVYEHTRRSSVDRMPGFRLGKYWRFNEVDIRTWLRERTQK